MKHPLQLFTHCPTCGAAHFAEHNEKSKQCNQCGFTYYFNPSAATVAVIVNGANELLVCRRAKAPAKGTLDLPGGFVDLYESGEEAVAREVLEETGLQLTATHYLFSIPNIYPYSGLEVHTLDLFFLGEVEDLTPLTAADDVAESFFLPIDQIDPAQFGLQSIRAGVERLLNELIQTK